MKLDKERLRPVAWLVFLVALFGVANKCRAQTVLACSDPWGVSTNCGGCGGLEWREPNREDDTKNTFWVRSNVNDVWTRFKDLPADAIVNTSTNGDRALASVGMCNNSPMTKASVLGVPPVYIPYVYKCRPKNQGEIRRAKKGDDVVDTWFCDLPYAIYPQSFCHAHSKEPDGFWSLSLLLLNGMKPSRECTASEKALIRENVLAQGVKITVAKNGTSPTRPLYKQGPNNTRATKIGDIRIVNEDGTPVRCGWNRLQNVDGTATNYFSVPGGYALCTVSGVVTK